MSKEKYKKHELRTHILEQSSEMYVGSITPETIENHIIDDNDDIIKKSITYSPALLKIFDELIVNASDHVIRQLSEKSNDKKLVKNIKVNINKENNEITVYNDGDGIPIEIHESSGLYNPSLIFGELLTSSNYDKSEVRLTGGLNGLGAKLSIIFSKEATIETVDHRNKKMFKQTFKDNLLIKEKPIITQSKKQPYTEIRCKFDLIRFGFNEISDDLYGLFKKRTFEIAALTPNDVNVYFNNKKVEIKNFEKFCQNFINNNDKVYEKVNDRWEIFASLSDDGFTHMSYVNGIHTRLGGKHVDYIQNQIVKGLVDLGQKKKKTLKPQFVKDNLFIGIKCLLNSPTYDSQTKEYMNTPVSKWGSKCEISDSFIQKLYKNSGIIDRALVLSDAQLDKQISKSDGKKLNKVIIKGFMDAPWAGTKKSDKCYLYICEGLSAQTLFTAGKTQLENSEAYGCAAIRGKLLNCKSITTNKLAQNEEISNLKKILGLESNKVYTNTNSLRYNGIICLVDADLDGIHIKGLITNMFQSQWPSLFKMKGFIKTMLTPIIRIKKNNDKKYFYSIKDFNEWEKNNNMNGWIITYLKGCGSSTSEEGKQYFKNMKLVTYTYDNKSDESFDLAFDNKLADKRKEWIAQYDKNNQIDFANVTEMSYTDLIHKELIHFSQRDIERNINNLCDGLKESQRKLIYSLYKKKIFGNAEIKVSQMAGVAASMTQYHHGDQSLAGALIKMGQNYIGSNNIPLVDALGQFGTRLQGGGDDSAQPRYLFTRLSKLCKLIFRQEDLPILNYKIEENEKIEPDWFIGIIPSVLVIQVYGIGTGYSTSIPNFNPDEVIDQCILLCNELKNNNIDIITSDDIIKTFDIINSTNFYNMSPYYPNYKGTIKKKDNDFIYESIGCYNYIDNNTIEITEIPIGKAIEDYKKDVLEELVINNKIKHFENYYSALNIKFIVYLNPNQKIDPIKDLKLSSTNCLSLNNMYLYNSELKIKKYNTTVDIFREWCSVRLTCYYERKTYQLKVLNKLFIKLSAKAKFINDIINNIIKIMNVDDKIVINKLQELNYPKLYDNDDNDDNDIENNDNDNDKKSYNYLLKLPVSSLTSNNLKKLEDNALKIEKEIDILKNTPIYKIWLDELNELKDSYKIYKDDLENIYNKDLQLIKSNNSSKKKK
tara:strand:+ start:24329 stop:27817 length:3489 start_codon:yes stop_codon:yes gene_type:complete